MFPFMLEILTVIVLTEELSEITSFTVLLESIILDSTILMVGLLLIARSIIQQHLEADLVSIILMVEAQLLVA